MINAQTFRLDGQLALVTGSSSGIGLALARGLAQAGASVVLNGRNADKLAQAAALLASEGLQVHGTVGNGSGIPGEIIRCDAARADLHGARI